MSAMTTRKQLDELYPLAARYRGQTLSALAARFSNDVEMNNIDQDEAEAKGLVSNRELKEAILELFASGKVTMDKDNIWKLCNTFQGEFPFKSLIDFDAIHTSDYMFKSDSDSKKEARMYEAAKLKRAKRQESNSIDWNSFITIK